MENKIQSGFISGIDKRRSRERSISKCRHAKNSQWTITKENDCSFRKDSQCGGVGVVYCLILDQGFCMF